MANVARQRIGNPENSAMEVSRDGMTVVCRGVDSIIDIVLVHGLNGHPAKTWTDATTGFYWPVALGQSLSNARVMVYGYDTDISPSSGSNHTRIRGIASSFLNEIRNERVEDDELERPLILIGHSLGGLVIKHALILAAHDPGNDRGLIYRSVRSVMFFGTPNAGSLVDQKKRVQLLKKMALVAFTEVPPKIESALQSHSDELLDLADDFRKIDICKSNKLLIYSFYETMDTTFLGSRVVDEFSARVAASEEEALPIAANHSDMVKFSGAEDKNFKNVVATVKRINRLSKPNLSLLSQRQFIVSGNHLRPFDSGLSTLNSIAAEVKEKKTSYFKIPNENKVTKFIGRTELLASINEAFDPAINSSSTSPISLVLIGMGGVGKTQVALEYCRQAYLTKHFQTVFWIHANSEAAVLASFLKILGYVDQAGSSPMTSDPNNREMVIESVLELFNAWPNPYLLVYDNFDDPKFDNILRYTPSFGCGALLFTSRLREAEDLFSHSINVDMMNQQEAIYLLTSRSGIKKLQSELDSGHANEIVRALDYLPLAIDQAGAYIKASSGSVSLEKFLVVFEQRKREILEHVPVFWQYRQVEEEREKRICLNVFTTWGLSLKLLGSDAEDREKKEQFLTLAAFLGGRMVSKSLLKTYTDTLASKHPEPEWDHWTSIFHDGTGFVDGRYRNVIMELNNLSLIRGFVETELGDLQFSFHPLVQQWAVLRHDPDQRKHFNVQTLEVLRYFFDEYSRDGQGLDMPRAIMSDLVDDADEKTLGEAMSEMAMELTEHIQACMQQDILFKSELRIQAGYLDFQFAYLLRSIAEFDLAIDLYQRRMEMWAAVHGHEDYEVVLLATIICGLRVQQTSRPEDVKSLEQNLQKLRAVSKPDDPDILLFHLSLIRSYHDIGQRLVAEHECLRLYEILESTTLNPENVSVMIATLVSGMLLTWEYVHFAEILINKASSATPTTELVGPFASEAQSIQGMRIQILLAQNRPREAEEVVKILIDSETRRRGAKHSVVIYLKGFFLSKCFALQGRWEDAACLLEPLLSHLEATDGLRVDLTQNCAFLLAEYLYKAFPENTSRAKELVNRVIEEETKRLGREHRKTAMLLLKVNSTYCRCKALDEVFAISRTLFTEHRQFYAVDDALRTEIEEIYATAAALNPARTEAETQEIIDVLNARLHLAQSKRDDALLAQTQKCLALFMFNTKRYEEALGLELANVEVEERDKGKESEPYWNNLLRIARCYYRLNRNLEAVDVCSKVYNWYEATYGASNDKSVGVLLELAVACSAAKKYEESARLYLAVSATRKDILGAKHAMTMNARDEAAQKFLLAGKSAEAAEEAQAVLTWNEETYGVDADATLRIVVTLAHALHNQATKESLVQSKPYYQRIVDWRQRFCAPDSVKLVQAWLWLSNCLSKPLVGEYVESVRYRQKVVTWLELNRGNNHEETMEQLVLLGDGYFSIKDYKQAIATLTRATNSLEASKGANDPKTLNALLSLGKSLARDKDYDMALVVLQRALNGFEVIHGPSHFQVKNVLEVLREVAVDLGDYSEAEALASRVLQIMKDSGSANEWSILQQSYVVAVSRLWQGRAAEAELDISRAVTYKKDNFGPNHWMTIVTSLWYALCLFKLGKYGLAAEHYRIVLAWEAEPPDFWQDKPPLLTKQRDQAPIELEFCESKMRSHCSDN